MDKEVVFKQFVQHSERLFEQPTERVDFDDNKWPLIEHGLEILKRGVSIITDTEPLKLPYLYLRDGQAPWVITRTGGKKLFRQPHQVEYDAFYMNGEAYGLPMELRMSCLAALVASPEISKWESGEELVRVRINEKQGVEMKNFFNEMTSREGIPIF